MDDRLPVEYILPLLRRDRQGEDGLVRYLAWLVSCVDVTVVDGSAEHLFAHLSRRLPCDVQHIAPSAEGLNGKVRGVLTGIAAARHEYIVIADDDVRYGARSLRAVVDRLAAADFVRPQNAFTAYPWHARWDTGRSLIGRALGGDYAGTVAVRRSILERTQGYSADVLFENLELERTVAAAGGRVVVARDLLVPRIPPTARHFAGQRVRQAYDDFAQPARCAAELAVLPVLALLAATRAWRALALFVLAVVVVAEAGRRSDGGAQLLPATSALWAPLWLLERAVAIWLAVYCRARGGIRYAGARVYDAATPSSALRRRLQETGGRTA